MITECRVCDSPRLEEVGGLGDIAISDFTDTTQEGNKYPLDLAQCNDCSLIQLTETTPRNLLYNKYWYKSGLNPTITADLKGIAALVKGKRVIDIGANDGTLLSFVKPGIERIAVEPTQTFIKELRERADTTLNCFWEDINPDELPKADTITAVAMLYDLDDPNLFVDNMRRTLAPDGTIITQLMTLDPMIESNDIGNICHEHIEYYSYKSLTTLFERNGLEIFNVDTNNINGGSYRLFARHLREGSIPFNEAQYDVDDLKRFFLDVNRNKENTVDFLDWCARSGREVYGYGASTKGNTILQYYGVESDLLPKIIDKNPDKWGKYTIGSKIPIVGEDKMDEAEYLWVMPWGFLDQFVAQEKQFISRGGKFVVSTPEFNVVNIK